MGNRKNLISLHEAIVLALINFPMRFASYEEIAEFIEIRGLYTERKGNIPLSTQVMLRATKSKGAYKGLFDDSMDGHIGLRDCHRDALLWAYELNEALYKDVRSFFEPEPVKLNVFDEQSECQLKKGFYANRIICIVTRKLDARTHKGRTTSGVKKFLYVKEPNAKCEEVIHIYSTNSSFEALQQKIDRSRHHLTRINDKAMVNVAYFRLASGLSLKPTLKFQELKGLSFGFSDNKDGRLRRNYFESIKKHQEERMWFKNSLLHIKSELEQQAGM